MLDVTSSTYRAAEGGEPARRKHQLADPSRQNKVGAMLRAIGLIEKGEALVKDAKGYGRR
jgi:hypothetical protein